MGIALLATNTPLVLAASQTAQTNMNSGAVYANISDPEAIELGAIVDQIIPADETPGATQIGVVYFIDAALGGFASADTTVLRQGLAELQSSVHSAYPETGLFSELQSEQQIAVLKSIEGTAFFKKLHSLTLYGMFSLPGYGGNREYAGWQLLGFDHRHAWQSPFGYYDALVNDSSRDTED